VIAVDHRSAEALTNILVARFGPVPATLTAELQRVLFKAQAERLFGLAVRCATLEVFLNALRGELLGPAQHLREAE
jgi:hypothetical protein